MSQTLGAELTKLSDQRLSKISPALTPEEVAQLVASAKMNAREEAGRGKKEAFVFFDRFERTGERKSIPVPKERSPAFEASFVGQDIKVTFKRGLYCGFCNMYDCGSDDHYGYHLQWN